MTYHSSRDSYRITDEWKYCSQNLLDSNRIEEYQAYCPICFRPLLQIRLKKGELQGKCGAGHIEKVFLTNENTNPD